MHRTDTVTPGAPMFAFGQPDGAIIQAAYNVADIDSAMREYSATLGAGPWFVIGPFSPPMARWRGQACALEITLAFAFSGNLQIELLQQHNRAASALTERPLGFHHWGIGTRDFEQAVAQRQAQGHALIFNDQAPDGARFAYLDTSAVLPGLIEIIEITPGQEAAFTMMKQAAEAWDGHEPVRRIVGPG